VCARRARNTDAGRAGWQTDSHTGGGYHRRLAAKIRHLQLSSITGCSAVDASPIAEPTAQVIAALAPRARRCHLSLQSGCAPVCEIFTDVLETAQGAAAGQWLDLRASLPLCTSCNAQDAAMHGQRHRARDLPPTRALDSTRTGRATTAACAPSLLARRELHLAGLCAMG
jgi:hypothetical protein